MDRFRYKLLLFNFQTAEGNTLFHRTNQKCRQSASGHGNGLSQVVGIQSVEDGVSVGERIAVQVTET